MSKKLLIIGAAALLLLGGGGAGAYFFLLHPAADAHAVKPPEPPKPDTTVRKFVTVDNLTAPVPSTGKGQTWIFFEISLEVRSDDDKKNLVVIMPRLRDAFLREIYAHSVLKADSDQIDMDGVRQRFLKVANQVAGVEVVRDVLITKTLRSRV